MKPTLGHRDPHGKIKDGLVAAQHHQLCAGAVRASAFKKDRQRFAAEQRHLPEKFST
jgi:hypothetical protein